MLEDFAEPNDVKYLAKFFAKRLPIEAKRQSKGHSYPEGREVWTKAVWHCFEALRVELGKGWFLCPKVVGLGRGRARGEYLADFMLMDERLGPRVACESELGRSGHVDWAFDKLRGIKSDIKIIFLESAFTGDNTLPKFADEIARRYLSCNGHVYFGEHYLILQLDHDKSRSFAWSPPRRGPLQSKDVQFDPLI